MKARRISDKRLYWLWERVKTVDRNFHIVIACKDKDGDMYAGRVMRADADRLVICNHWGEREIVPQYKIVWLQIAVKSLYWHPVGL